MSIYICLIEIFHVYDFNLSKTVANPTAYRKNIFNSISEDILALRARLTVSDDPYFLEQ